MKALVEFLVQRVVIPLAGVYGLLHNSITGDVDPVILPAYLFMMGLAAPAIRDAWKKGGDS